jgi:hypothetical protein
LTRNTTTDKKHPHAVDQDERGNAERRALFVGLWPPMFRLIGDTVEQHEQRRLRLPWNS